MFLIYFHVNCDHPPPSANMLPSAMELQAKVRNKNQPVDEEALAAGAELERCSRTRVSSYAYFPAYACFPACN